MWASLPGDGRCNQRYRLRGLFRLIGRTHANANVHNTRPHSAYSRTGTLTDNRPEAHTSYAFVDSETRPRDTVSTPTPTGHAKRGGYHLQQQLLLLPPQRFAPETPPRSGKHQRNQELPPQKTEVMCKL